MIKGLFWIFFFLFLGNLISTLTGGFVPGNVIGMLLLFTSLYFKLLKPESVRAAATVITKNMAVFFVVPAVGLMVYADLLAKNFLGIFLSIIISTILTMATVAFIQEWFEKRQQRKTPTIKKEEANP